MKKLFTFQIELRPVIVVGFYVIGSVAICPSISPEALRIGTGVYDGRADMLHADFLSEDRTKSVIERNATFHAYGGFPLSNSLRRKSRDVLIDAGAIRTVNRGEQSLFC